MDIKKASGLISDVGALSLMTTSEKRAIAQDVIEEIINQIEHEARNPTEWEKEALSYSFGLMLSGLYVAAINEAMFCFSGKDEVDRPDHWWAEAENLTIHDLRVSLAYVLDAPHRGD